MTQPSRYKDIIDILNEVVYLIQATEGTDVAWPFYGSGAGILSELADHINRLAQNDLSGKDDLKVLFGVTGPLDDISMSRGWYEQFSSLAKRFDHVITTAD